MKEKESQQKKPGFDSKLKPHFSTFLSTCYHAAGHAVMMFITGQPIKSMQVAKAGVGNVKFELLAIPKNLKNCVSSFETNGSELELRVMVYAMIHIAGYVAEFKFLGVELPVNAVCEEEKSLYKGRVSKDENYAKVRKIMESANELSQTGYYDDDFFLKCVKATQDLLEDCKIWKAIDELVCKLKTKYVEHEGSFLQGPEAEEIINFHVPKWFIDVKIQFTDEHLSSDESITAKSRLNDLGKFWDECREEIFTGLKGYPNLEKMSTLCWCINWREVYESSTYELILKALINKKRCLEIIFKPSGKMAGFADEITFNFQSC